MSNVFFRRRPGSVLRRGFLPSWRHWKRTFIYGRNFKLSKAKEAQPLACIFLIEIFQIEFRRIYRIYRICSKLFLVVLKMKITNISLL